MTDNRKIPVVFHGENGNLHSYINAGKYESFDKLETSECKMDMYIGFNPQYMVDVFRVVDSDKPVCVGTNPKSAMMITGNEYSFVVLPIHFNEDYKDKFADNINGRKAV